MAGEAVTSVASAADNAVMPATVDAPEPKPADPVEPAATATTSGEAVAAVDSRPKDEAAPKPAVLVEPSVAATTATTATAPAPISTESTRATEVSSDAPAAGAEASGKKRPPPNPAEGCADAKRLRADFKVGDRGVFYTTMSPGKAHEARRDLVRLLEDAMPDKNHSDTPAADTSGGAGGARLDAELRRLKNTPARFTTTGTEVAKGTGFVKFVGEACDHQPSEVVVRLLQAQRADYLAQRVSVQSKLICRVLPIDNTCKPHLEDFKKLAEAVLQPHLGPNAEPTVWALEFRARNTVTLKKEAVLDVIDGLVCKERHKVNLNDPVKCILVEVNPLFCGLSILPRWGELKKYNLHALSTPDEPNQKKATVQKSPSAATSTATGTYSAHSPDASPQNGAGQRAASPEPAAPAADGDGASAMAGSAVFDSGNHTDVEMTAVSTAPAEASPNAARASESVHVES